MLIFTRLIERQEGTHGCYNSALLHQVAEVLQLEIEVSDELVERLSDGSEDADRLE